MTEMTNEQKKMMFCIEALRNHEKKLRQEKPNIYPYAEELFKLYMHSIGQEELYEVLKDRTAINESS